MSEFEAKVLHYLHEINEKLGTLVRDQAFADEWRRDLLALVQELADKTD